MFDYHLVLPQNTEIAAINLSINIIVQLFLNIVQQEL